MTYLNAQRMWKKAFIRPIYEIEPQKQITLDLVIQTAINEPIT